MKRTLSAATIVVGLAAALLGPVPTANAVTDPAIKVALDKPFVFKGAPMTGVSTTYQVNRQRGTMTVADCAGERLGCYVIPIELLVPQSDPDALEAAGYILSVTLEWETGQGVDNVPEVGTQYANQVMGDLWQDPPARNSRGNASYTATSNGTAPGNMVAVSPRSNKFNMIVANFVGKNEGYTLKISLTSADSVKFDPSQYGTDAPPSDYVQPTFTIPDSTPQMAGFGGASGPSLGSVTTPVPQGQGAIVVPDIAGGEADARLLAMGQTSLTSGLGRSAVTVSSVVASTTIAKSGTTSIVLSLLALPVLGALGLLLFLRRRTSGVKVPVTA